MVRTYTGITDYHGATYTLTYRRVGTTATGRGVWEFEVSGRGVWMPVRNVIIRQNLDAGNHPRDRVGG